MHTFQADLQQDKNIIRELFWEYLQWANKKLNQEFDINFDIASAIDADMQDLDKFMPPNGCLLLCYVEGFPAGIACLKYLSPGIGEVKRMYIRPSYRRMGLGRALLDQLLKVAIQYGYERIRLDSVRFMKQAHHLYRTVGFSEIEAYEGSEVPKEFQKHWIFMEVKLQRKLKGNLY